MSKIKCLIVDDEPLARKLLKRHLFQIPEFELVGECANALEAIPFLRYHTIDVLFLDIQMPKITGLEFLRNLQSPPKVVFTTAFREYAIEAFELNVVDYLVKPIIFSRFLKTVDRLIDQDSIRFSTTSKTKEAFTEAFIYLKTDRQAVKIFLKDILYIESMKDYVKVYTLQDRYVALHRISLMEAKLPTNDFLRVHRSYIIALQHLTAWTTQYIKINNLQIPIGRSYKTQVIQKLGKQII